jgi:type IV secretion system protein TrbI
MIKQSNSARHDRIIFSYGGNRVHSFFNETADSHDQSETSACDASGADSRRAFLDRTSDRRPAERACQTAYPASREHHTGIRSDLRGQITAQVTQNVYDSPTGRILRIPEGSRLIGDYDADVGFGQSRMLLAWNRLILTLGVRQISNASPVPTRADLPGFRTAPISIGAAY